ncbi:hypothetical protein [Pacificibacter marinus]|uniref:Uncharacterized protein n=1 Tax=Pacificibacter marinus TaxID=658057 RepID=A0A1Y5RFF0_9RHOB|nr:hypothetical protein [Pacificibacter marinus]SEK24989.1 hypothetical protein SAMN04488032_101467 [Pacificibacter marinus]SLN13374.1 hypothetical protein PAM7971_00180 [Pacificibacter marinus]
MSSYQKLKKLGWLSAYSRQVLLTRYLARTCADRGRDRFEKNAPNESFLFLAFKLCVRCPQSNIGADSKLSAPYQPSNRPDTFTLKSKHSNNLFMSLKTSPADKTDFFLNEGYDPNQFSWIPKPSERALINKGRTSFGDSAGSKTSRQHDSYLFDEVSRVGKGISLSNKALADTRCENLWREGLFRKMPLSVEVREFIKALESHPKDSFLSLFLTWYKGLIDGVVDWELWQNLSEIPEDIWEAGPAALVREFEVIQAKLLAKRAGQATDVVFDSTANKFRLEYSAPNKPDLLGATLDQISDALDDALANPSNGLHERSRETKVLWRALAKYANNAQRLEMDFTSVHDSITRQIANEELPPSEENLALLKATQEGAQGIRATHSDIAENREILTKRALAELTIEQVQAVSDAKAILLDISIDELADDFAHDIDEIIEQEAEAVAYRSLGGQERNPASVARDEKVRLFSYAAKILLLIRKTPQVIDKIVNSRAAKLASLGTVVETFAPGAIVDTLKRLVEIGISLF